MIYQKTPLDKFLKTWRDERERGSSIVLALLVMVIFLSLSMTMVTVIAAGLNKGKEASSRSDTLNAAEVGMAHALALANNSESTYSVLDYTRSNPMYGENTPADGGKGKWRWFIDEISTAEGYTYEIYSTGYKNNPNEPQARTVKVSLDAFAIDEAYYGGSLPVYGPSTQTLFGRTLLATNNLDLRAGSAVKVYDSAATTGVPTTSLPTIDQVFYANNKATVNDAATIPEGKFTWFGLQNPEPVFANGWCTGSRCTWERIESMSVLFSMDKIQLDADANCPLATYPDWVASANAGKITAGTEPLKPKCYGNMIFDSDTTVDAYYDTNRPATIFAKGNIVVKPGVWVNQPTGSNVAPANLIIKSTKESFELERGTGSQTTRFFGMVAGNNLTCGIGTTGSTEIGVAGKTQFYGSLLCKDLAIESKGEFWHDKKIRKLGHQSAVESAGKRHIWYQTDYEYVNTPAL